MKKISTLVAVMLCTLAAMATNYDGQLTVTVNGEASQQEANITLEQNDSGYKFILKNFIFQAGEDKMGIGNIVLDGLTASPLYGYSVITAEQDVEITNGDDPSIDTWVGPMLGAVPVKLSASFVDDALDVTISIYMATLEQNIQVHFFGTAPAGLKGDLNADGTVNVADVTVLIEQILAGN